MAETILEIVLEKFTSFAATELGLFLGFDEEKKRLESMLTAIKATLQDAEEKQFSDKTEAIKDWLRKLKNVSYELDDILDECAYQQLGLEHQRLNSAPLHKVLSSLNPKLAVFRYKIAKRMKKISGRLDQIAKEKDQLHLSETAHEWPQTTSFITEPKVCGREEDMNKIVDFLTGDASYSEDLSVYPILGLGGLGKTTLTQLVYNHTNIVNHFEKRIWVCVSEDFSLKRMTKAIIQGGSEDDCENLNQEQLNRRLQDLLRRKRYLLVLDDVWDEGQENWQNLKSVLACGAKGTSILVTTRLSTVAEIMRTAPPYELSVLSDNDCWELFKYRAFGPNKVEEEHVELVKIGEEIVKKCGGVPLAAKALGGLLRFERKVEAWLNVKESNVWSLTHDIMPALRLSYLNLPIKLRKFFAYCAIFPKDAQIEKQYLVELWMANGFVSSKGMLDAEDVGDRVWHELYWRSFFQDLEKDVSGKVTSFKMHDLFHDLAEFVAEEICCITEDNDITSLSESVFHVSEHRSFPKIQFHKGKSLRTCIWPKRVWGLDMVFSSDVLKCYSLRVLDFEERQKFSIGHLKHLRYLNLSKGLFKTLPESIGKLWHLHILKLDNCHFLQKLPNSMIHLKSLQLSLNGCDSLLSLPPHIGKLTSLKCLTKYIVGNERGFLLAELGLLKLKGHLHIKHLEKLKSVTDAEEANMSSKQLSGLVLSWDRNEESELQENVEKIVEVLQLHTQHLQTLKVVGYEGSHFPQWMSSVSLKYLTCIKLIDCKSCLQLPQLVKLPSLKTLSLRNMSHVKYLYEEPYNGAPVFMALEKLSVKHMPKLIRLSREDGENIFARLAILKITECPELLDFPSRASINALLIRGECHKDLESSIHKLSSLEYLLFGNNEELTCFPDGMQQNLTSLKKLVIMNWNKWNMWADSQCLTYLEALVITKCREVEGLHEALQHMTALQDLALLELPNLESLPDCFGNLPLLRRLSISGCPKLICLPASLSRSNIKELYIFSCPPALKNRCEKEKGEDWPKIAHIPEIFIR